MGEIALHEHRFDQAIELAMQGQVRLKLLNNKENIFSIQQIPIDEYDWYRSVVTVIESLRQDTNQDSYKRKKVKLINFISKNIFLLIK